MDQQKQGFKYNFLFISCSDCVLSGLVLSVANDEPNDEQQHHSHS